MENNRVIEFLKNPKRALFILALPVVVEMSVENLYNISDTAFVGRLGSEAIAAVTFSFPLYFFLFAIYSIIETGTQSKIARLLGTGDKSGAENVAMHGITFSILLAILVTIFGIIFLKPILILFGASGRVLSLSMIYMTISFYSTILMYPSFLLSNLFIAQGDSKTSMIIQGSSLGLNIILDPIFIYILGFGVAGSAITNAIGYVFAIILGLYFLKKKSYLKLKWSVFKFSRQNIYDIFKVGVPASFMIMLLSVYVVFINKLMAHFGTDYVAMFGISSRIENLATLPVFGVATALLTLAGMFYGAKKYDLVKEIIWYGLKVIIGFTFLVGLLFFIFPWVLYRFFTPDPNLINLGIQYMRIDVFTFPLMAIAMVVSRVLQGLGSGLPGFIINLVRIFIVAVPLAYIFVYIFSFGFLSIAVAMVAGGVIASIVSLIWLKRYLRKITV
jgi:putative MATE family efflux protein